MIQDEQPCTHDAFFLPFILQHCSGFVKSAASNAPNTKITGSTARSDCGTACFIYYCFFLFGNNVVSFESDACACMNRS